MAQLDHAVLGKANRQVINRHDAGRAADTANAHNDPASRWRLGDAKTASGRRPQEQIQIIRSAIGRPVPNAPPIIKANA